MTSAKPATSSAQQPCLELSLDRAGSLTAQANAGFTALVRSQSQRNAVPLVSSTQIAKLLTPR